MKECNSCRYLQWVTTTDTDYFCAKHEIKVYSLDNLCIQYEPKKKTNADKIRAMSDEELVDAWYYVKDDVIPRGINTRQDILNWLRKEADE